MSFFGKKIVLPFDDSDKIVEAADFGRRVHFTFMKGSVVFAFEEFVLGPGPAHDAAQLVSADDSDRFEFVLPAGRELWAGHSQDGETVSLAFLVTAL